VGSVAARRSTALRFTLIARTMSRSSGMPGFRSTWSPGISRGFRSVVAGGSDRVSSRVLFALTS
jgi:hypothetical protein